MTEMTAFERRVAEGMLQRAGPIRPVDDLAVYESVVATIQTHRWDFTMISALKLVAAVVVLTIFGGFLLASVLTTRSENEVLPATATESPSPTTVEELLAGMATEEIEPGVYRVLDDGVRTLEPGGYLDVVAGHDGGTWLTGQDGFFRLGDDGVHEWPGGRQDLPWGFGEGDPPWGDFEVAHDGTVWTAMEMDAGLEGGPEEGGLYIWSFDGDEWEFHLPTYLLDGPIEVTTDGTVWAVWFSDPADHDSQVVGYLGVDGWTAVGEWPYLGSSPYVSDEGDVWAFGGAQMMDLAVHRFVDGMWSTTGPNSHGPADIGSDGTVWAVGSDGGLLHRFDGTEWTPSAAPRLEAAEPESGLWGGRWSNVGVAPDGSVWAAAMLGLDRDEEPVCGQGVGGVVHFDSLTWSHFLTDACVDAMDVAADGSVWAIADDGLYVITPEALATAEASPRTTEELLSGMVTEEVEPGVFRVDNDGVRDLAKANDTDIVAGQDGGIWLLRPQRFFRLGGDEEQKWAAGRKATVSDFEVGPDGMIWTIQTPNKEGESTIESFDGEEWTTHHEVWDNPLLEITPEGTVWAMRGTLHEETFGYYDEDGWHILGDLPRAKELLVAGSDDVWAIGWEANVFSRYLYRFVDGAWQRWVTMEGIEPTWQPAEDPLADNESFGGVAVGPDGTFWGVATFPNLPNLVRFDDTGWSRWPAMETDTLWPADAEGMGGTGDAALGVAPDGSVWVSLATGSWDEVKACDGGVGHFDGEMWDRYLSGLCVEAIDITADGAVWLLATEPDDDLRHVYVVTPEAVLAAKP